MRIFLSYDSLSVRFFANSFREKNGNETAKSGGRLIFSFSVGKFLEGWNKMRKTRKKANTYYYACVNRKTPDFDRQLDDFRSFGAEECNIFTDREGKRDIYRLLINDILKSGDTLVIGSLFCLGEKTAEIIRNMEYFMYCDVRLDILDVPVTFSESSDGNMLLIGTVIIQMLLLLEKKKEPKPHKKPNYPANWEEVYTRYVIKHEITARQARELTGLSQYLLAKYIREYTEEYTDCSVTDADQPEQN